MTAPTLGDQLDALCKEAVFSVDNESAVARIIAVRERLHDPLRVAIAGRVKAGKSTLLNALVGERLAPTDAGECTKVVCWYGHHHAYSVTALLADGSTRAVPFHREDGAVAFDVDPAEVPGITRLQVGWPSSRLQRMTLIDTPGIGSTDDLAGERTAAFFALDDDAPSDADAVVYLMRHAHYSDAQFLDSFLDRSVANSTPVNALGVLSRADEVGAGRLDALDSAAMVASRYASDSRLRPLISGVVAVAGLIAETGATLQEREAANLRRVAQEPRETQDEMLLSVDHFTDPEASDLTVEARRELLQRLGLFGVRYSLARLREGDTGTATSLSRALLGASGLERLRGLIEGQFAVRAHLLKARSALTALRAVARDLDATDPDRSAQLARSLEVLESSAHELAELRMLHMLRIDEVRFTPVEAAEAELVVGRGTPAEKVGFPPGAPAESVRKAALAAVGRWRARADSPLTDRPTAFAADVVARSYEGIYAALGS